jgi:23S rRNA pseudouridine2605 synthase
MAKEFKRNTGKDPKNNRSDSKRNKDPKKGKKPSFERYRDESKPSDFGTSSPRRNSDTTERKRKPFGEKPAYRKREENDSEERSSFKKNRDDQAERPSGKSSERPSFRKRSDSEETPAKRRTSDDKRKSFDSKPSFKKRFDSKTNERPSRKTTDDFYESKPSFVRESDKREFDYEAEFQSKKKGPGSSSKKHESSGREDFKKRDGDSTPKRSFRDKNDSEGNFSRPYKKRSFEKKSFGKGAASAPRPGNDDGTIRLNKYISNAGICSRREADELIESGVVQVNGKIITEMGYKVKPTDVIKYGGQTLKKERLVYIVLNKPKDYITTVDDPQQRKTVLELVQGACRERIYPVGRLDRATTGLLMFTNDGDLTKKLTHPRYGVRKVYHVELDKPVKRADLDKISEGLVLEDGEIKVDDISYVGDGKDKTNVGVELHSGKNRIVRRIFEHLGYNVRKLDRVVLGPLTKKDLPRGRWRALTEAEIGMLKMISSD